MNYVIAVMVFGYAVVNAFGAWAVVRRKGWVAGSFMLAAALLTVAAVALAYGISGATWMVVVGVALASAMSFVNAVIVIGRVSWRAHVFRAIVGAALAAAAWWVLR